MPPIVAFIGRSGSGKTTTIEFLVKRLTENGLSVGVAKHVHHPQFTVDTEGKDSWRYSEAGAGVVAIIAEDETTVKLRSHAYPNRLEEVLAHFNGKDVDIVFLEGFHYLLQSRSDVYKIVTARDANELQQILPNTCEPIIAVTGKVATTLHTKPGFKTPLLNIYKDGEVLAHLVEECIKRSPSVRPTTPPVCNPLQVPALGIVNSPVASPTKIPAQGVAGSIELFDGQNGLLELVEGCSHVIITGMLNNQPQFSAAANATTGGKTVMTSTVRLLAKKGKVLMVDSLTLPNETIVIGLKPYSPALDAVFSARWAPADQPDKTLPQEEDWARMLRQASNFHGETCAGLAIGVKAALRSMKYLNGPLRDPEVTVVSGTKPCITDAVQAVSGATSRRLKTLEARDQSLTVTKGAKRIRLVVSQTKKFTTAQEVFDALDSEVFESIEEA